MIIEIDLHLPPRIVHTDLWPVCGQDADELRLGDVRGWLRRSPLFILAAIVIRTLGLTVLGFVQKPAYLAKAVLLGRSDRGRGRARAQAAGTRPIVNRHYAPTTALPFMVATGVVPFAENSSIPGSRSHT